MQLKGSRQPHTGAISNIAEPESDTSGKHAKDAVLQQNKQPLVPTRSDRGGCGAGETRKTVRTAPKESGRAPKRAVSHYKKVCNGLILSFFYSATPRFFLSLWVN